MTAWEGKFCFSLFIFFIFSWFACIKLRRACATLQSRPFKHLQKWRLQHNSHVFQGFLFFKEEYRTLETVLDVALEPVSGFKDEYDRMGSDLLKLEQPPNNKSCFVTLGLALVLHCTLFGLTVWSEIIIWFENSFSSAKNLWSSNVTWWFIMKRLNGECYFDDVCNYYYFIFLNEFSSLHVWVAYECMGKIKLLFF